MSSRAAVRMLAAVGLAAAIGTQAADVYRYTARTATASGKRDVVASGVRWQCHANECTTSGPWATPGVGACAALARQVGHITAYGHSKRKLSDTQLAECNRGTTAAAPSQSAPPRVAPATASTSPGPVSAPATQLSRKITLRTAAFDDLTRQRTAVTRPLPGSSAQYQLQLRQGLSVGTDCDDMRHDVNPRAVEVCDGRDNNCDGRIDEGVTVLRYLDADGDGHGDPARSVQVCPSDITAANQLAQETGSAWLVEIGNDCDDRNPDRWRGC